MLFKRLAFRLSVMWYERLASQRKRSIQSFLPVGASALLLGAIVLLTGCGGGSGGSTPLQGNAGFRAATVASYQSLGAGVAYPYTAIKLVSPTGSALRSALALPGTAPGRSAPTRAAGLTLVSALNLYTDGGVFANNVASVNFFTDAAGTQPAGSIVITIPSNLVSSSDLTTYKSYPAVIPIVVNLTAGNIPCHGDLKVTFNDNTGANSLTGSMTLTKDNVTFAVNLGLDDQFNVSGTVTVQENGATIQATNVSGSLSGTLTCNVTVLPYNWTGTGTLSLLDGSMSLSLKTGTGTSTATADSAGNVTIVDADGTKDTIHDSFLAGLIAGSNDTITAGGGTTNGGTTNGGTTNGGTTNGGTTNGGTTNGGTTNGGTTNGGTTNGGSGGTPTYNAPVNLGALTPVQINNSGQILGITTDSSQIPVFLQSSTATAQKLLGVTQPFQAGVYSALRMNNSGQIVGFGGNVGGAYWPTATSQPQLLASGNSSAYGISDSGLIVGQTYDSQFTPITTAWPTPTTPYTMTSLGIYDTPLGISPDGQIVGWTYNSNAITLSYWKSYKATPTALAPGTLAASSGTVAMSVNAAGQICGTIGTNGNSNGAAYWASPTSPGQYLPGFGLPVTGSPASALDAAYSINAGGTIVGSCFSSSFYPVNYHAVVWKSLKVQDLNTLIPTGSGWVLTSANSINDSGVIVGVGQLTVSGKTQTSAFLLTPK